MKIILAIDSFKGSLTSAEAGQAAREAILQLHPEWETDIIPIADGGEGMLCVMLNATQGIRQTVWAHNPCMELTPAKYGISADGTTAFIEMANISGLPLITEEQRNPMTTSTVAALPGSVRFITTATLLYLPEHRRKYPKRPRPAGQAWASTQSPRKTTLSFPPAVKCSRLRACSAPI